jgi:hypothetical protein
VVTLNTVKMHVSHLPGKLAAANRTEAVTRARQLGPIPKPGTGSRSRPALSCPLPPWHGARQCQQAGCGKFHRHAHFWVTPHRGAGPYRPSKNHSPRRLARAITWQSRPKLASKWRPLLTRARKRKC